MGIQAGNKFTWVIRNFSSLQSGIMESGEFVIGGCKWRLLAYLKGNNIDANQFSLYLVVADSESLPCGWRRHAKFRLTVLNQLPGKLSQTKETLSWFDQKAPSWGFRDMRILAKHNAEDGWVLVNKEVKVVAEVEVLQVIGKSDVFEDSEEVSQPLKKCKLADGASKSNGLLNKAKESVDVNGFHVLPSQVEFVRSIFEKHPGMALEFRAKSQHVKAACMNVLLSLVETLCQPLQELSENDMAEADIALGDMKALGFKVDWLEKKLEEVKKKKKEEQIAETRIRELEKELKYMKRMSSSIEGLLEEEKEKVLAARTHLTMDDFV